MLKRRNGAEKQKTKKKEKKKKAIEKEVNLHVTDSNAVIIDISDNLILNLLPALHWLLNQNLRGDSKAFLTKLNQLLLVITEARAKSSKGVGGSHNDRVTHHLGCLRRLFDRRGWGAFGALLSNAQHRLGKQFSIFGQNNRLDGGSKNLDWKKNEGESALASASESESVRKKKEMFLFLLSIGWEWLFWKRFKPWLQGTRIRPSIWHHSLGRFDHQRKRKYLRVEEKDFMKSRLKERERERTKRKKERKKADHQVSHTWSPFWHIQGWWEGSRLCQPILLMFGWWQCWGWSRWCRFLLPSELW